LESINRLKSYSVYQITMKQFLIPGLILALAFTSCKKETGSIYDCKLTPEFLEGGYKKINVSMNGLEIFYNNQYYPPCKRDDILVIFSTVTYNMTEGEKYCNPASYEEGNWILSNDTLVLNNIPLKVTDFSCIGFRTEYRIPDPLNPDNEILVITTYNKVQ